MKMISAGWVLTVAVSLLGTWLVAPARADLLLRWTFDEESGPAADHGAGIPAEGMFVGEAARTTSTPGSESMRALDLVGANSGNHNYVAAAFPAKLNQLPQMTLAFWINMQGAPANLDRVASFWTTGPTLGWELRIGNPSEGTIGAESFRLDFRSNAIASNSPDIVDHDNEWLFLAVTYDSTLQDTNTAFYLGTAEDQVAQFGAWTPNSHPVPGLPPEGTEFRVGSTFASSLDRTPPAWIDDFRIYDEVLGLEQLEQARLAALVPTAPGDFDSDGDVDGADFLTWQRGLGLTGASQSQGDADGDADVDADDLGIWQANFSSGPDASASAVPEPGAFPLIMTSLLGLGVVQGNWRHTRR